MSVLAQIVKATLAGVERRRARLPLSELKCRVADAPPPLSLEEALSGGFSMIGEIKAKSPSVGEMDARNVDAALSVYAETPAVSAVSVLTQEEFFGGSLDRLKEIRHRTAKPLLRKDFILDAYQVWEARAYGADAILLMASLHVGEPACLANLYQLARSLGLDVLVEIGMGKESPKQLARMVPSSADIWGINSRQFESSRLTFRARIGRLFGVDFTTLRQRHAHIRRLIPPGKIAVAESGIRKPVHLDRLVQLGYDAALIGTAFLKGPAPVEQVVSAFATRVESLRQRTAGDRRTLQAARENQRLTSASAAR